MRTRLFALALLLGLAAPLSAANPSWVYLGGYTGGKSGGKGIMVATFDSTTGTLSPPTVAVAVGSPSFLAPSPDGKTLYAIGEAAGRSREGGPVYAYRVDPVTGTLTLLNQLTSGGSGPCHVAVDPAGEYLAVANYGSGSMAIFRLKADGSLDKRTAFVQHAGSGPDKARQEGPHAHCSTFDPTGNYVMVCDLGIDCVLVSKLDRATGTLTPRKSIVLPPGSGPRHIDLSPDGRTAYINGEMTSTVHQVQLDLDGDKSEVVASLLTLPQPTPGNSTAECRLHPSNKHVYVSNRGHNSVAVFDASGATLKAKGHITGEINIPRNFNFDPSGQFILVANQDGNSVTVFKLGADGLGTPVGKPVATPAPVCIKFVPKA